MGIQVHALEPMPATPELIQKGITWQSSEGENNLYPIELDLAIFSQRNYTGVLNLFFSESDQATKWHRILTRVCGSYDIDDYYTRTRDQAEQGFNFELGAGETVTFTAMQKRLRREVYVRVISKVGLSTEQVEALRLDIQKHTICVHYGVRRLLDFFEDKQKLYLCLEWPEADKLDSLPDEKRLQKEKVMNERIMTRISIQEYVLQGKYLTLKNNVIEKQV